MRPRPPFNYAHPADPWLTGLTRPTYSGHSAHRLGMPEMGKERPCMTEDSRPGAAYSIDHYAIPTTDLLGWMEFMERALGGEWYYTHGLTTSEAVRGGRPRTFYWVG